MEGLKDYILREDAVAAVMETDPHIFLTYNKKKEKTDIVVAQITEEVLEEINKIPAADVEPRWIPVTERLPEKYGQYLVTFIPSGGTLWTTVLIARYSDLMGIAKPSFHIGEVGKNSFANINEQVIAWMPLPEPYKGGEEK